MTKLKKYEIQQKSLKARDNSKILKKNKKIHTTHGVTKCKNKRCRVCNMILKGKSYIFEKQKTSIINKKKN